MAATATGAGLLMQGAGSIFGAHSQDQANKRNFNAAQQQQNLLNTLVQGQLNNQPNQYSTQILDFLKGAHANTIGGQGSSPYTIGQNGNDAYHMTPATLGDAPMADAAQIDLGSIGTQAQNTGQDALMQMLKRDITPGTNPDLSLNLQQLGQGNTQYDNTGLFNAIDQQGQQQLDDQLAQLHGSAGSLGQRFGTAMLQDEGRLRTNYALNNTLGKQQIGQQSFEAAQGRRQPALNLQGDLLNQANQFGLQGLGLQQQAATNLGQLGQAGAGLNLQALLANAANQQQSNLANQGILGQYGIQNANYLNQAGQFNAGQNLNVDQYNSGMNFGQDQFNAGQQNLYQNFMLQALMGASGLQSGQNSLNAQLLGILGGVGVPQQGGSPWGGAISDIGGLTALAPFLFQLQQRGGRSGVPSPSTYGVPYGGAQFG